MNIKFVTIFLLLFLFHRNPLAQCRNARDITFETQIEDAQKSFENVYYELVKKGHFGIFYNNNLIIDSSPNFSFSTMGPVLLDLIDWLEAKDDFDSCFLLKKINKLFCYQLHRYTCKMEIPKDTQATMWNAYHELFKYKTSSKQKFHVHPFRTCLAKAMIYLFSVRFSGLMRTEKIESLVYYLEKLKEQTIKLNESFGDQKLEKSIILDFMNNLEAYSINDPLVKPRSIKRIALIVVIALPMLIGGGWFAYKNWPTFWNWVKDQAGELTRAMGREFTEGAFESQNLRNAENRVQGNINNIRGDVQHVTNDANGLVENINQTLTDQLTAIRGEIADLRDNTIPQAVHNTFDSIAARVPFGQRLFGSSNNQPTSSPPQNTTSSVPHQGARQQATTPTAITNSDTQDTSNSSTDNISQSTADSQPGYLRSAASYLNPLSYLGNNNES